MNQKTCQFYSFLQAARGNWHNALFIRCGGETCPLTQQPSCEGYLLAAGADGQPLLLSAQAVRRMSGESVEPMECTAVLECRAFRTAYAKFIEWHTISDTNCPLRQLCPDSESHCT